MPADQSRLSLWILGAIGGCSIALWHTSALRCFVVSPARLST